MVQQRGLRIAFFGTPDFAVPALQALAANERYDVRLVVSQPDRPAGRGQRLTPPPVKVAAESLGLPIYQPVSLGTEEARAPLKALDTDLFVVAAFGLIFGAKTLAIPRSGCVNLHASLLPKYRGASPIAAAIAAGDEVTGISLMRMELGLDTGPVIASSSLKVNMDDTTASLTSRLADLGAVLAVSKLSEFAAGVVQAVPQPTSGASIVRSLSKADGWLDWTRTAVELERWVRAMWPWPRAWTTVDHAPMQVHKASVVECNSDQPPGTVVLSEQDLAVQTSNGGLLLEVAQLPGGNPVDGGTLRRANRIAVGSLLGRNGAPAPQPPIIVEL